SEPLANRAAPAVAGHEILGVDAPLFAAVDRTRDADHAVVSLLEAHKLRGVAELGAQPSRVFTQDRLERLLREEQPPRRAHRLYAGIEARDVLGDLLAGKRFDR